MSAFLACADQSQTPLIRAAALGDTQAVQGLLAAVADANARVSHGETALMVAARGGHIPVIQMLLGHGADPNLRGGVNGWTPVMHAIHKNQKAAVAALLDGGADVNARSRSGLTALIMAAGYGNTEIVQELLARGADPYAEARDGSTALAAAVGGVPDIDNFTLGTCQTATVRALLEYAPDLRLKDNFWSRSARLAASLGRCSEVLELVRGSRQVRDGDRK